MHNIEYFAILQQGQTALHLACRNIYGAEATNELLVKGADPEAITTV